MALAVTDNGPISLLDGILQLLLDRLRNRRFRQLARLQFFFVFRLHAIYHNRCIVIIFLSDWQFDSGLLGKRFEKTIESFADRLHSNSAGYFSGLISSHPIGDDKETAIPRLRRFDALIRAVFILLALPPHIGFIGSN